MNCFLLILLPAFLFDPTPFLVPLFGLLNLAVPLRYVHILLILSDAEE